MAPVKQTPAKAPLPKAPYVTLERVQHDGVTYRKGNVVNLNILDAARLIKSASVLAVTPTTTVDEANLAIDLKEMDADELRAHATEIYRLDLPAESTADSIIEAIENARAVAAAKQNG